METIKRMKWQQLRSWITHIPAHNPGGATLAGTNCFLLGSGSNRVLIEAGDDTGSNKEFM